MKFIKSVVLGSFLVMICGFNAPAVAGVKEQKALNTIFSDMLDIYEAAVKTESASLIREGDLIIEDSGSYYAVTLPHLKYQTVDGYTDIGMIAVNAVPEDDNKWKMTLALPTPIVVYNMEGAPVVTTDIGAQNFTGIWDDTVKYFTASKAIYRDIKLSDPAQKLVMNVPEIAMAFKMEETAPDRWTGPMELVINGLNFTGQAGATGSIKSLKINSTVTDYSFKEAMAYQDKLNALNENYTEGGEDNSGVHTVGLYNMITEFIGNAWEGFDFDIAVEGVNLHTPASVDKDATDIMLGNGHFGFGMNGFRTGTVTIDYKMGYSDITITPAPEGFDESTPQYLTLDFSINSLPYKELAELGKNSIQGSIVAPEMAKIMGIQALMQAPQLLTKAGTNLTIRHADLGNEVYILETVGELVTDIQAVMGIVGDVRIRLKGLPELIETLDKAVSDPTIGETHKKKLQDLLGGLAILQMAGQIEKNDAGEEIRVYNIKITADGKALLNGTDIGVFMNVDKAQ